MTEIEQTKQVVEYAQPFSVEISTNAKGQHQWVVKLSGIDIDKLTNEATRIDDMLSEKYISLWEGQKRN